MWKLDYWPGMNLQRVATSTASVSSPGLIGVSAADPPTACFIIIIIGRGGGGEYAPMLISSNVPSVPRAALAAASASARAFSIAAAIAMRRAVSVLEA